MIARARARLFRAVAAWFGTWWAFVCERARMRLSAVLMDAGAYLALDPVERRARRLRRRLLARRGRRVGPYAVLLRVGAKPLAGEATLEIAARATADGRVLSLLCGAVKGQLGAPAFYWAVKTAPAHGCPGGARTSMLHEREGALETALVAFFSEPVPPALAGLDKADPHEPVGEGLGRVPEIGEAPAA